MKRLLGLVTSLSMLLVTPPALAGGHGGGWKGHGHGYYGGHGYRGHGRYYRGYHENNDNRNDSAAYVLGGLLVGGLVTNAYYRSRAPYATYPSTTVYRETTYTTPSPAAAPGRRLLRDLEGHCYERQTDGAGNEIRIEIPAENCNW